MKNVKIAGLLAVVLLVSLVFVGCFGCFGCLEGLLTDMQGGNPDLIGDWDWNGALYYEFEAGGFGMRRGEDIRWSTYDGVLHICWTPDACGNTCIAPERWDYILDGDELTLTRSGSTTTYTRR